MSEGIAYQNKDIEFKIISECFKEKSFAVYGLSLPKIKEVLPTNLPRIAADEKRLDNLFLLEDGTIAIVDYESDDKLENRIKYLNYIARVMEKYYNDNNKIMDLRMIVIYTGDVEKADNILETSCLSLRMEQVFLSHMPEEEIYQSIKEKIEKQEKLTDENVMQLIILPLTVKGKAKKQERLKQVIELAKQVKEEQIQVYIIAGVLINSDKFIEENYSEEVRRWLRMTKVFRLFEEEKQEAINEAINKTRMEEKFEMATRLIELGLDTVQIMKVTELTKKEVEQLKKKEKMLAN